MPKVPERKLSYGEITDNLSRAQKHADNVSSSTKRRIKNGLPHPWKCSKCTYTATSPADSRQHWRLEH